jgi:hypothetical protein
MTMHSFSHWGMFLVSVPYDKTQRARAMQRRVKTYVLDEVLPEAARGDFHGFLQYCRAGNPITEWRHLDILADIIERRLVKQRGAGRKPGTVDYSLRGQALNWIVNEVTLELRRLHKINPGFQQVPKGIRDKVIEDAWERLADEGAFAGLEENAITLDHIRAKLKGARIKNRGGK